MSKNNKKTGGNSLFVCNEIVSRYNITAAFVMAQVAYHIIRHGRYDTAHIATANYTKLAKSSVIKYLKLFVKDGLLLERAGNDLQRPALVFNYNQNEVAQSLAHTYDKLLSKSAKTPPNWVKLYRLTMLDITEIDNINLPNMKAARARSLLMYKNMLIDKFASNKINNADSMKIELGRWSAIARLFGCSVNTAKSILEELKETGLIKFTKKACIITCSYAKKLAKRIDDKCKYLQDHVNKLLRKGQQKPKSRDGSGKVKPLKELARELMAAKNT